jgi:hypothetical protein
MKLACLCPHPVRLIDASGRVTELLPEYQPARLRFVPVEVSSLPFGPVTMVRVESTGLPEPKPDRVLLVSTLVRMAHPLRADLVSPGDLILDPDGIPIGCRALYSGRPIGAT